MDLFLYETYNDTVLLITPKVYYSFTTILNAFSFSPTSNSICTLDTFGYVIQFITDLKVDVVLVFLTTFLFFPLIEALRCFLHTILIFSNRMVYLHWISVVIPISFTSFFSIIQYILIVTFAIKLVFQVISCTSTF